MIKRIVILVCVLSAAALLAMAPMNVTTASENAPRWQTTVEVTLPVVVTSPPDATPGPIPVTGGGMPLSTWIIFGLLAILGLAVVIGGMALLSRRQ